MRWWYYWDKATAKIFSANTKILYKFAMNFSPVALPKIISLKKSFIQNTCKTNIKWDDRAKVIFNTKSSSNFVVTVDYVSSGKCVRKKDYIIQVDYLYFRKIKTKVMQSDVKTVFYSSTITLASFQQVYSSILSEAVLLPTIFLFKRKGLREWLLTFFIDFLSQITAISQNTSQQFWFRFLKFPWLWLQIKFNFTHSSATIIPKTNFQLRLWQKVSQEYYCSNYILLTPRRTEQDYPSRCGTICAAVWRMTLPCRWKKCLTFSHILPNHPTTFSFLKASANLLQSISPKSLVEFAMSSKLSSILAAFYEASSSVCLTANIFEDRLDKFPDRNGKKVIVLCFYSAYFKPEAISECIIKSKPNPRSFWKNKRINFYSIVNNQQSFCERYI